MAPLSACAPLFAAGVIIVSARLFICGRVEDVFDFGGFRCSATGLPSSISVFHRLVRSRRDSSGRLSYMRVT